MASIAREQLNKSENERSGVVSTAMSFLGLFRDPVIAANTAQSDFRIADLAGRILSASQAEALVTAVRERWNIMVVGGTSSGKTTLVNALLVGAATMDGSSFSRIRASFGAPRPIASGFAPSRASPL